MRKKHTPTNITNLVPWCAVATHACSKRQALQICFRPQCSQAVHFHGPFCSSVHLATRPVCLNHISCAHALLFWLILLSFLSCDIPEVWVLQCLMCCRSTGRVPGQQPPQKSYSLPIASKTYACKHGQAQDLHAFFFQCPPVSGLCTAETWATWLM